RRYRQREAERGEDAAKDAWEEAGPHTGRRSKAISLGDHHERGADGDQEKAAPEIVRRSNFHGSPARGRSDDSSLRPDIRLLDDRGIGGGLAFDHDDKIRPRHPPGTPTTNQ